VSEGEVLIEIDRTVSTAERNRVGHELLRARLDAARLTALRAALEGVPVLQGFVPPAGAIARTRAALLAQAEQQAAKLAALDQQIAQKRAEASAVAAMIVKLESGLPMVEETAEVRRKAVQIQYGNRIAHLEAQLRLSDQRNELVVQQRRAVEAVAALEAQRRRAPNMPAAS